MGRKKSKEIKKEAKLVVGCRLNPQVIRVLEEFAAEQDRTLSWIMNDILETALAEFIEK